jgi:hypothetical protein
MLIRRGNIQQYHFVGSGQAVSESQFCGIAGITQAGKLHTFHYSSGVHVQAGDDALG